MMFPQLVKAICANENFFRLLKQGKEQLFLDSMSWNHPHLVKKKDLNRHYICLRIGRYQGEQNRCLIF